MPASIANRAAPPCETPSDESPLAAFRAAFAPEVADVEMLRVEGLPVGTGLRIATLDTYDGIVYSVGGTDRSGASGQFSRLPYRLDQSATPGEAVRLEVAVLAYDDVWVPGVGQFTFNSTGQYPATAFGIVPGLGGVAPSAGVPGLGQQTNSLVPGLNRSLPTGVPGTSLYSR